MIGLLTNECGTTGGMRIGKGNQSNQRKPAPLPLCPTQMPYDLTRDRTLATMVESWQ
jgi:hypothetical protein